MRGRPVKRQSAAEGGWRRAHATFRRGWRPLRLAAVRPARFKSRVCVRTRPHARTAPGTWRPTARVAGARLQPPCADNATSQRRTSFDWSSNFRRCAFRDSTALSTSVISPLRAVAHVPVDRSEAHAHHAHVRVFACWGANWTNPCGTPARGQLTAWYASDE
jgi:hypothetical protein